MPGQLPCPCPEVHAQVGQPVTVLSGIPGKVVENPFLPSSGDGMFHVAFEPPKGYEPLQQELVERQVAPVLDSVSGP